MTRANNLKRSVLPQMKSSRAIYNSIQNQTSPYQLTTKMKQRTLVIRQMPLITLLDLLMATMTPLRVKKRRPLMVLTSILKAAFLKTQVTFHLVILSHLIQMLR